MAISDMIQASPTAAVISDPRLPDNPIISCNDAFIRLTGYEREEIVGRNCRFLRGADTEPWLSELLRNGIRQRQPVMVEILNYKKDGSPFRNAVMVAPIFDAEGELEYFLGSQMEVVEDVGVASLDRRRLAHEKVESLTRRQREILLLMAAGKLNCVVECSPLLGPLAFDALERLQRGETLPKRIVVEDRVFTAAEAAAELPNRKY